MTTRFPLSLAPVAALAAALSVGAPGASAAPQVSKEEAAAIAERGFTFGYPLVLMDATRAKMTAVPSPSVHGAPANQFCHMPVFPDASFVDVVSPNADTLYSVAWLDLTAEPMVLSVPDTGGRYYLMPMLSAWTDVFASPGKRTTGTAAGAFAICGPRWKGALPAGVKELRAPTATVWVIGRTQTNGKQDFEAVHAIQRGYALTPLSSWGRPYTPPAAVPVDASIDLKTPPADQVAKMDGATFFSRLAALMEVNPPSQDDAPILAELAKIGVVPGAAFQPDPALAEAIDAGRRQGLAKLLSTAKEKGGAEGAGWTINRGLGDFGTDYEKRAGVALFGLGANLDADAIYPAARLDADGKPFDGAQRYVLHFEKGMTPPVNAFWSLTMYNERQAFVDNPLNRYAIGDRDALKQSADGSLDLWIQHDSPGADKESNWLPAPAGSFNLIVRMYWPKEAVAKGNYQLPPVKRVD